MTFGPAKPTMSVHALNAVAMAMLRERGRRNTTAAPRGVENALIELVVGLHHESLGYGADSGELRGSVYARALTLIRAHHHDPTLSPTVIAERLQLSLRSLQRAFAAHDTTVAFQIRRLRAHRAAVLLQEPAYTRTTVAEIAAITSTRDAVAGGETARRSYPVSGSRQTGWSAWRDSGLASSPSGAKKTDSVTSSAAQSRDSNCAVGLASPRSMREIIARLTPERPASSSRVRFLPLRSARRRSAIAASMCVSPFSIIVDLYFYNNRVKRSIVPGRRNRGGVSPEPGRSSRSGYSSSLLG